MAHFPPESVSSLVFFTKKEVALQLRITERTLFNIMAAGEITWVRVGSQARFTPADIAGYLERGRRPKVKKQVFPDVLQMRMGR
jgi:excisionase family DNA binding protein